MGDDDSLADIIRMPSPAELTVQAEPKTGKSWYLPLTEAAPDYGVIAHRVAVDHVQHCMDYMDAEEPDEEFPDGDPASAPFDGCLDCIVRESLSAAAPILEAGVLKECGHG